jgi:hypothetical protein
MTPAASPTTHEIGETWAVVRVEAAYVLAPRVRQEKGPGSPRHLELLLSARQAESLSTRAPHGRGAVVDPWEVRGGARL